MAPRTGRARIITTLYRSLLRWTRLPLVRTAKFVLPPPSQPHIDWPARGVRDVEGVRSAIHRAFRRRLEEAGGRGDGSGRGGAGAGSSIEAIECGFELLRHLNGPAFAEIEALHSRREQRRDRHGVRFHVGEVVRHAQLGYRAVIFQWHPGVQQAAARSVVPVGRRPANSGGVSERRRGSGGGGKDAQPQYFVLPDAQDVAQMRLSGLVSPLVSLPQDALVAVPNPDECRVHDGRGFVRTLFRGVDAATGRFVPSEELRFQYPADDLAPTPAAAVMAASEAAAATGAAAEAGAAAAAAGPPLSLNALATGPSGAARLAEASPRVALWSAQTAVAALQAFDGELDAAVAAAAMEPGWGDASAWAVALEPAVVASRRLRWLVRRFGGWDAAAGVAATAAAAAGDANWVRELDAAGGWRQRPLTPQLSHDVDGGEGDDEPFSAFGLTDLAANASNEAALESGYAAVDTLSVTLSDAERLTAGRRRGRRRADAGVRYKVGETFRHKQAGYRGVVAGWDARPIIDVSRWDLVTNLPSKDRQPFYTAHVDLQTPGGTRRTVMYVAEENIELDNGGPLVVEGADNDESIQSVVTVVVRPEDLNGMAGTSSDSDDGSDGNSDSDEDGGSSGDDRNLRAVARLRSESLAAVRGMASEAAAMAEAAARAVETEATSATALERSFEFFHPLSNRYLPRPAVRFQYPADDFSEVLAPFADGEAKSVSPAAGAAHAAAEATAHAALQRAYEGMLCAARLALAEAAVVDGSSGGSTFRADLHDLLRLAPSKAGADAAEHLLQRLWLAEAVTEASAGAEEEEGAADTAAAGLAGAQETSVSTLAVVPIAAAEANAATAALPPARGPGPGDTASDLLEFGAAAMYRGDWTGALAAFDRLAEMGPSPPLPLARAKRASALLLLGRLTECVVEAKAAIAAEPRQFQAMAVCGQAHLMRRQYSEAVRHLEAALTLNPWGAIVPLLQQARDAQATAVTRIARAAEQRAREVAAAAEGTMAAGAAGALGGEATAAAMATEVPRGGDDGRSEEKRGT